MLVLSLLFLTGVTEFNQNESLGYLYGFRGQGEKAGSTLYEITASYPQLWKYFGMIIGIGQYLFYSVVGIFIGKAIDK